MIEDVILTTDNCRYCLMCRHVCPVGHVTRLETLTPHGWGLTIASIRRGVAELDEGTVNVIYSCADCGTCRANCITDQPLPSAIAAMRAEITSKSLAPEAAYRIREKLENWRNPYGERPKPETNGKGETALFVGDDAHFLAPQTIDAVLTLLSAIEINPVLVGVGRNNGYLASSLGFPEIAAGLMQETLDDLAAMGAKRMLVLSPGDYYAFHQLHEDRNGIAWPENVKIQEVIPLLAEFLESNELTFKQVSANGSYAYVDPTHSVRVPARFDAPRELLSAVMASAPLELFWRRERAHPCGNGGLQFTQPEISSHLAYSRLDDGVKSGARILYTEDPGSQAQLARYANRFGLEVKNLYELLAKQIA